MSRRPLDSDSLGHKGETRFGELCVDANLIANIASRDRAGWDYVVDFRLPSGSRRLDARPAPISARIQVKTQWADQGAVKLRLSAAEQLIKHNGPSFICVLSVDDSLRFTRMQLVHCRGEVIARVLERLRRAESEGQAPNKVWLSLKPADFTDPLEPEPAALRQALEAACSTEPLVYLKAKDGELRTLGFDGSFMELNASFVGDEDDVLDAFLGLRSIEAEQVIATQTRFGIKLPYDDLPISSGTISFKPQGQPCTLAFRTAKETLTFKAKAFRPPGILAVAVAKPKVVIRTDSFLISLIFTARQNAGSITFKLSLLEEFLAAKRPAQVWRDVYAAFSALNTDGVELSILLRGAPPLEASLKLDASEEKQANWRRLAQVTDAAFQVLRQAKAQRSKVSLDEIWKARSELDAGAALMSSPQSLSNLAFSTAPDRSLPIGAPLATLFGHAFKVGDLVLAYAASMTLHGTTGPEDGVEWTSGELTFVAIERVRSEAAFHRFLQRLVPPPCVVISGIYQKEGLTVFYRDPTLDVGGTAA